MFDAKKQNLISIDIIYGGRSGIRTLEGLSPLTVFKTVAFNRSAKRPLYLSNNLMQNINQCIV